MATYIKLKNEISEVEVVEKDELSLSIDSCYSRTELNEFGLKEVAYHGMDYSSYTGKKNMYFFESINDNYFRLFCITGKASYYLS